MLNEQGLRKLVIKSQSGLRNLSIRGHGALGPVPRERPISVNPGLKFFVPFLYFKFQCIAQGNILCYHYCSS